MHRVGPYPPHLRRVLLRSRPTRFPADKLDDRQPLGRRHAADPVDVADVRRTGTARRLRLLMIVFVALLIGLGVLFGSQALVVDLGYSMGQQGVMQNSADAGALAAAKLLASSV